MMRGHLLIAACSGLCALGARADSIPLPADAPPVFKAECTSCHIAFSPALLVAADWKRIMAALDKHYGDNASLDDRTRRIIEDFLLKNARKPKRELPSAAESGGELPRLTTSIWFKRKHHEVGQADWTHVKVKTPANCAACHTQAAAGSFREREIVMPSGRRWEG
jgi:nitrate/TMAO reductase-like tetraheme cytochrome c subunit